MRLFLYICLVLLTALPVASAQSQFFETLYDVPIMKGMEELPEMALSFDKTNGRISEAGAVMTQDNEVAIADFYKVSLFQMGWQLQDQNQSQKNPPYVFTREDEELSLYIEKSGAFTLVRFLLQPLED